MAILNICGDFLRDGMFSGFKEILQG